MMIKNNPNSIRLEGMKALTDMFLDYLIEYHYYDRTEETPLKYQPYRLIEELYERGILERAELDFKNGWVFYVNEPLAYRK
tara:strand:+ start:93 stop:335 length:243 start_codon:yes stop_codon:yes gene_type:complete